MPPDHRGTCEGEPPHRGSWDRTGNLARPVQIPWTCHQTGDCCRAVPEVVVTAEEKAVLERHAFAALRPLIWEPKSEQVPITSPGTGTSTIHKFWSLKAAPCPFLADNLCTVHAVRPYNCRRFMCGRVDVHSESFESGGPLGCFNLSDRINTSLRWMNWYQSRERAAQKEWAKDHGWGKDK